MDVTHIEETEEISRCVNTKLPLKDLRGRTETNFIMSYEIKEPCQSSKSCAGPLASGLKKRVAKNNFFSKRAN